jgi:dimethylargininase
MNQPKAFVRPPGNSYVKAQSQHPENAKIDVALAKAQHEKYTDALELAGVEVIYMPTLEYFPDSVFVEDTAIFMKDCIAISYFKGNARRGETECIQPLLVKYGKLEVLGPPVTVDGGDVLNTGKHLFIGQSKRTNEHAVGELGKLTNQPVVPVPVEKGLHLKTSATYIGRNIIVLDPYTIDRSYFEQYEIIEVDEDEGYAANCLAFGENVLIAEGNPKLAEKLDDRGFKTIPVPMSEYEKANGGLTCLSLVF